MDEFVVAVLAGESQHNPFPVALQVTDVNRNDLPEGYRGQGTGHIRQRRDERRRPRANCRTRRQKSPFVLLGSMNENMPKIIGPRIPRGLETT